MSFAQTANPDSVDRSARYGKAGPIRLLLEAAHFTLPFPTNECPNRGIAAIESDGWSKVSAFRITNSDQAAAWLPIARSLPLGITICAPAAACPSNWFDGEAVGFHSADLPAFHLSSFTMRTLVMDALDGHCLVPCDQGLRFVGQTVVSGFHLDRGFTPVYIAATPHDTHLLVPDTHVCEGFARESGEFPREVFAGGRFADASRFYRAEQLFPGAATDRDRHAACDALYSRLEQELEKECPVYLPETWRYFDYRTMQEVKRWNRLRREGWQTREELCKSLGIDEVDDVQMGMVLKSDEDIFTTSALVVPRLYRPVTITGLIEKAGFSRFLDVFFPQGIHRLLRACFANDEFRRAMVAQAFDGV